MGRSEIAEQELLSNPDAPNANASLLDPREEIEQRRTFARIESRSLLKTKAIAYVNLATSVSQMPILKEHQKS